MEIAGVPPRAWKPVRSRTIIAINLGIAIERCCPNLAVAHAHPRSTHWLNSRRVWGFAQPPKRILGDYEREVVRKRELCQGMNDAGCYDLGALVDCGGPRDDMLQRDG